MEVRLFFTCESFLLLYILEGASALHSNSNSVSFEVRVVYNEESIDFNGLNHLFVFFVISICSTMY